MLTQKDIDNLMLKIQSNIDAYVYYIAHMVECREGYIDEYHYKSAQDFRVLKLKVNNITNAYFKYLEFVDHPEKFHTEKEESYSDEFTKYVYYYNVPTTRPPYDRDLNPRIPSAIYGMRRILYKSGVVVGDYTDPSPIKPLYTNTPIYGDYDQGIVTEKLNDGKLDWKYIKLSRPLSDDGINYRFITSDWYILDIENFPRTEMPLINVKQKTAYFMTNNAAQSYMRELKL